MAEQKDMRNSGEEIVLHRFIAITSQDSPLKNDVATLKTRLSETIENVEASDFHEFYIDEIHTEDIFANRAIDEARHVFSDYVRHLVDAQIAIIDLTYNPAAYYVLGIRHALSNGVTLALSNDSETPAFTNARFAHAEDKPFKYLDVSKPYWLQDAAEMTRGLNVPQEKIWKNDLQNSGVFQVKLQEREFRNEDVRKSYWAFDDRDGKGARPKISIWKGDIAKAKDFDVWVNSENTHMEMARFWDKSVSAKIRKLGSVRQPPFTAYRRKDALGLALAEQLGTTKEVKVGTVFITPTDPASELAAENKVQCVAHLASVEPNEETYGFRSGGKIDACVGNVLKAVHTFKGKRNTRRSEQDKISINSILFPLIGSGDGGAHPSLVAHQMIICLSKIFQDRDEKFGLDGLDEIGVVAYLPSHFDYLTRELESSLFQPDTT